MRTCTVQGCDAEHKGHGLCYQHLWRFKRHGPNFDRSPIDRKPHRAPVCIIEGCDLPHKTRGLCVGHYTRWQRHGDTFDHSAITQRDETGKEIIARALRDATPNKCIEWPLNRNKQGYGYISINGKNISAHRYICQLAHGNPPAPRLLACHLCDNPPCINKHHLRWDTYKGNAEDRTKRGRGLKGMTHHKAKLTEDQVREIKKRLANGETCQPLANEFGVTNGAIWFINKGVNWRHID